jgi:hypothetical protein
MCKVFYLHCLDPYFRELLSGRWTLGGGRKNGFCQVGAAFLRESYEQNAGFFAALRMTR